MLREDRLPAGTPLGWGTAAHDHNVIGLYHEGPQPAAPFLARLIKTSEIAADPLPPALAQLALTREAQRTLKLRRMLFHAAISPANAGLPLDQIRRILTRRAPRASRRHPSR